MRNQDAFQGRGEKRTLVCWWRNVNGAATVESRMEVPQKTEDRTAV